MRWWWLNAIHWLTGVHPEETRAAFVDAIMGPDLAIFKVKTLRTLGRFFKLTASDMPASNAPRAIWTALGTEEDGLLSWLLEWMTLPGFDALFGPARCARYEKLLDLCRFKNRWAVRFLIRTYDLVAVFESETHSPLWWYSEATLHHLIHDVITRFGTRNEENKTIQSEVAWLRNILTRGRGARDRPPVPDSTQPPGFFPVVQKP
jgi:hypothetical protein